MIPGSASPFFLGSSLAAASAGGLQISRSLRFNSSDSAYLSRTPAVAGNRRTFTWSGWLKRSSLATADQYIFGAYGTKFEVLRFEPSTDRLQLLLNGGSALNLTTTQVFRDFSAWYHFAFAVDTTQSTASDRAKLYVNGSQITTFSTSTYPTQNYDSDYNNTVDHQLGALLTSGFYNGYLANIHFIDGQALTPSSFTETDATTGQLIPKTYTGSYGTNGFNLLFADNSSNTASTLGKDTSGLSNNWTPNNFSISTGSVATATGALPVFNTTDTYGAVKGTGTRTDTNSASIVLALPMDGTNGGTSFGDQSAVIKGSGSAKTITANGNAQTSTALSKFYGSSGYFDGTGDYLQTPYATDFNFGSGDFTIETFVNISALGTGKTIANYIAPTAVTGNDLGWIFGINTSNQIEGVLYNGVSAVGLIQTGSLVTGRWYHVAYVRSGTNFYMFLDGVLLVTASGSAAHNVNTGWNISIGYGHSTGTQYMNGYLQDLRIYKGVAKYTSTFSVPAISTGAGNDSLVDSPVNGSQSDTGVGGEVRGNYCTINPLIGTTNCTISNGNLDVSFSAAWRTTAGTFGLTSGKWYWENTMNNSQGQFGIVKAGFNTSNYMGSNSFSVGYMFDGNFWANGAVSTSVAAFTTGDIIGVAFDADNGTLTLYKNNASQGQLATGLTSGPYFPGFTGTGSSNHSFNAGQRAFAYTAPSGFKGLCTQNLPAPLVTKSNEVFDVVTYTGTGATQTITGLAFNPDFLWIKNRNLSNYNHHLTDVVRGVTKRLKSNTTGTELTSTDQVTAYNSNGFSLGADSAGPGDLEVNQNSATYVGWAWDAGTSTVSNTAGSITSQVRANATAGFSVVTYTGTGANATVGHGLGVAPGFIIIKNRSAATNWRVYHSALGNTKAIFLSTTGTSDTSAVYWNNTSPTSTVFSVGSDDGANGNTNLMVAYCFTPVVGYSSFGSYTGNGSADGPFVYTGMRPRWIIIKRTDSAENWTIYDTARDTYNAARTELFAHTSSAESAGSLFVDLLSNGFKIRNTNGSFNASSATYIYAAFAEAPINYARAR